MFPQRLPLVTTKMVSYGIYVRWTDYREYDYRGYASYDLAESHYDGFVASHVVDRVMLYGVDANGERYTLRDSKY